MILAKPYTAVQVNGSSLDQVSSYLLDIDSMTQNLAEFAALVDDTRYLEQIVTLQDHLVLHGSNIIKLFKQMMEQLQALHSAAKENDPKLIDQELDKYLVLIDRSITVRSELTELGQEIKMFLTSVPQSKDWN